MKQARMTEDQMQQYVRHMDADYERLQAERDKILGEIKSMQDRKEILSWEEIASAVAYPKAAADNERIGKGAPDEFKLFHQAERINRIYISQMEELFEELEAVEVQITKYRYIESCITKLDKEDRIFLKQFIRPDLTYEKGMEIFHTARSTLYRAQKRVIAILTEIYNSNL